MKKHRGQPMIGGRHSLQEQETGCLSPLFRVQFTKVGSVSMHLHVTGYQKPLQLQANHQGPSFGLIKAK